MYLAISLVFVITTLLEFAVVLFLKRKITMDNDISKISALNSQANHVSQIQQQGMNDGSIELKNVSSKETITTRINGTTSRMSVSNIKTGLCLSASLTTRIDITMFCGFIIAYLMFNIIYWYICLSI